MRSATPAPRPKPCTKAVLPAPRSPARTMTSPGIAKAARASARARVSSTEVVAATSGTAIDVRTRAGPALHVPALHAGADRTDDLVGDGAEPSGPLVRGDAIVALGPEQHGFVATGHLGIGTDVDHHLVHRDD